MINFNEKYKTYIWPILGAIVLFIFYIFFQNIFFGERGGVRKFILQGKKAVESKNILTCANMISTDYHDKYGNDRGSLICIAKDVFSYYKQLFVHIESTKIVLDDSKLHADVEIVALAVGQTQQNNSEKILEGEKGRFRIKLVKENKKWLLLEIEFFEPITIMGQTIS